MDKPQAVSSKVITALMAEDKAGRLRYIGPVDDSARYAIVVNGAGREFPAAVMHAWLTGWRLAATTVHRPVEVAPLDAVRAVLVAPSLADQCRTAILAAMETAGLDFTSLATATGRTRNACRDALRYGNPGKLSVRMADAMMAATGHTWSVCPVGAAQPTDRPAEAANTPIGRAVAPEPVGVRRMRAAAIAHEHRLVTWVAPLEPNRARRPATFTFTRADVEHPVPAAHVEAWLLGLADRLDPTCAALLHNQ